MEVDAAKKRYEVGLEKIDFTGKQVAVMQTELTVGWLLDSSWPADFYQPHTLLTPQGVSAVHGKCTTSRTDEWIAVFGTQLTHEVLPIMRSPTTITGCALICAIPGGLELNGAIHTTSVSGGITGWVIRLG